MRFIILILILFYGAAFAITLEEVQKQTLKHSVMDIKKLKSWERNSRLKYFVPTFKAQIDKDTREDLSISSNDSDIRASIDNDSSYGLSFSASWDFGKILYNTDMLRITQEIDGLLATS